MVLALAAEPAVLTGVMVALRRWVVGAAIMDPVVLVLAGMVLMVLPILVLVAVALMLWQHMPITFVLKGQTLVLPGLS
jgi:hypothetical protein